MRMRRQVSSACAAWATHTVILKFMLYLMGIPSAVPFLETVAYAGYPFVLVCLSAFIGAAAGVRLHSGHTPRVQPANHHCIRLHCAPPAVSKMCVSNVLYAQHIAVLQCSMCNMLLLSLNTGRIVMMQRFEQRPQLRVLRLPREGSMACVVVLRRPVYGGILGPHDEADHLPRGPTVQCATLTAAAGTLSRCVALILRTVCSCADNL